MEDSHSDRYEVISHVHFLIVLFVFLVLSSISSLYVLEINPLSDISLANTFSHIVGSLFILLMVSFAVQKLFHLMDLGISPKNPKMPIRIYSLLYF